ncbi:hypothetical protein BBW65_01150 [Helicobacter enhydrae]|uniref:Coenzyme A biosynthesis bifunctional protein CoaBC n=1 Tax=Helicobacter enhydrae TaxID=222136 RepID=A0A1B1U417_9HELI|nr:bifunctional phosphopantothenoylcysteine decarboxylase/phosphopantothenate--cysteine ligase CoaBC [Helicobacter enhydrae]ANV97503.1 hypothetical protein BBW65_01150 [Helicobacter enhydrae]
MKFLQNQRVLLCVSGGIAVYKSLELVRLLQKAGASVRVVMSEGAQRFVTPLSFEALSGAKVLTDGGEDWTSGGANHISYASWADVCIFAPASMNSLAKFAYGIADNAMLSTLLALKAPVLVAPSANTNMYLSSQSQEAMDRLRASGHRVLEAQEGLLACGVYGVGAMVSIEEIAWEAKRWVAQKGFWNQKQVIVSGGGSSEAIDEVRCISNHSSGIQASYFALALYLMGAEVSFVSSRFPIALPRAIKSISVKSAKEYLQAITELRCQMQGEVYYFGVAAIGDFVPTHFTEGKIKKSQNLELTLKQNIDILKSLSGVIKIGFKAEKDSKNANKYARAMLEEKGCDFVCLNVLDSDNPFGASSNAITLLSPDDEIHFDLKDKFALAWEVLEEIARRSDD